MIKLYQVNKDTTIFQMKSILSLSVLTMCLTDVERFTSKDKKSKQ